ncbi:MAG: putative transcriptional regulator, MarR family [Gammaproteobacteria bacterium]|nr:putative transcriptional regulator, MarR family [Gammaproteobacteria bacterium]
MSARALDESALELAGFIPFRLNRLAAQVSDHLSGIYRERFGLDIPEWRVMATVGPVRGCTAQYIAGSTRMHKTRVSRAIAHLEERGLMVRATKPDDRREMELRLTKAGRRMYAQLVPLALERERALLACMSEAQLQAFVTGLDCLETALDLRR